MCGIAGVWGGGSGNAETVKKMARCLEHRGPDGEGTWSDLDAGIALGHRRLSIIDLSPAGAQPMASPCGRYVLVFNGEIYNHLDLRAELESQGANPAWNGQSDTETLVTLICAFGIPTTLDKLNGMFAFALWDRQRQTLTLARDRLGEKPLYYAKLNDSFVFASELKALYAFPNWAADIDRDSLALYMRYNHVPAPKTIFKGVYKLLPAHYLTIPSPKSEGGEPVCYWDLKSVVDIGRQNIIENYQDLMFELDGLLKSAVSSRMLADVPLGAFLSGGYDSTMVVAQMQAVSSRPVKTFTIGNFDSAFDEAKHAGLVAKHLDTDHTELYVSDKDALHVIPRLPSIYDEPFADSSQIPTYLVSRLAKQHVSVALAGDGGDELFGGYNRHVTGSSLWDKFSRVPQPVRSLLSNSLGFVSSQTLSRALRSLPYFSDIPGFELKLKKVLVALGATTAADFYDRTRAHWVTNDLVLDSLSPDFSNSIAAPIGLSTAEKMMFWDMQTYLANDILTKIDRASMAVSLEAREPFLDHRLVEFSWRIPLRYKIRDGKGKWILRDLLYKYVPKELMDRPKQGFGIPLADWLRGPLRDWAESLLEDSRLKKQGFLNPRIVKKAWDQHQRRQAPCEHEVWCVLMFQAWLENYESRERFGLDV